MSYLYRTLVGSTYYKPLGQSITSIITPDEDTLLDSLVDAGVVGKEGVLDYSIIAASSVNAYRMLKLSTTKAVQMGEADTSGWIGCSISSAEANKTLRYVKQGLFSIEVGEGDLADGDTVIAGQYGKAVKYNASQVKLINAVTGQAGDDFTNTIWGSSGQKIQISTTVNVANDSGKVVTVYFLDADGIFTSEQLTLNLYDTSVDVSSTNDCLVFLGYSVSATLGGTLRIRNEDGDTCATKATPSSTELYGFIGTAETSGTVSVTGGHFVKVASGSGAVTGKIILEWLTNAGDTVYETLDFSSDSYVYSTYAYGTLVGIFIGDDAKATGIWSVTVEANTAAQKIGTVVGAIGAGGIALVDYAVPDTSVQAIPFAGIQGALTAGGTKYIGVGNTAEVATDIGFFVVPYSGKWEGLIATLETAPASSNTVTLTVRKNSQDTSMVVTITGTATSGVIEGTNTFSVVAGDKISIKSVASGSNSAANLNITGMYRKGS